MGDDVESAISWMPVPRSGLDVALTDTAESEVFRIFFAGYDRAFVLPSEKEDEAGLVACLALNHDAAGRRLAAEHGRFREICLIARDGESRAFVGGANFFAVQVAGDAQDAGPLVSANLNYVFVESGARGRGYFGRLVAAVRRAICHAMDSAASPLVFIELNDPLRMSAEDYARDTAFTGLDQLDRMRIWAKRGARVVDHPYVQPPLAAGAAPDDTLVYGVLCDRDDLPACTLRDHLRKFFAISVLKGAPLDRVPVAQEQVAALDALCAAGRRIALLDPAPLLSRIAGRADIDRLAGTLPRSTREALHALRG